MNIYQWLCLFSVPSIIAAVFVSLFRQVKAACLGVQALLRAQLIAEYNKWDDRGYAPIYARQNFENCWTQYHALGKNGVMDDLHEKFLRLPVDPPEE